MKTGIDITVLNDSQKTGIAVYTYNLVDSLLRVATKDDFILFGVSSLATYNYLKGTPLKNYQNAKIKVVKMPAKFFRAGYLLWQRLNWPKIEKFIGGVDIYHSFNYYLPPQKSGKTVATVFDLTALKFPKLHMTKTTQLDKLRFKRISKYADLVITISEASKKDFLSFYPNSKVEVIYPAPSLVTLKVSNALKKYALEPGYLLSVATLEPRKNLEFLIKAYLKSNLKAKLVLVGGSGWKNQRLIKLIKKYPNKIKALGFVPDADLATIYKNAQIFIYPSLYEGFGIPILDAFLCGVPVITSNTSSMPEAGGDAAYYINPKRQKSLINALNKLVENKDLRKQMIQKGYKQVNKFSWEASAKKLYFLYQDLISE